MTNNGVGTGNVPISDSVYLSYDQVFDPTTDRYLGSMTHNGGLGAGAQYTENASITLPRGLFDFTTLMTVDWQAMSAMATLMVIPPAIFVIFAQRYLIKGLILGAGR